MISKAQGLKSKAQGLISKPLGLKSKPLGLGSKSLGLIGKLLALSKLPILSRHSGPERVAPEAGTPARQRRGAAGDRTRGAAR